MADTCCSGCKVTPETADSGRRRQILIAVLIINALMFVAEFGAGFWFHSTALQADSIDMLIDAIGFGFSLLAVQPSARAGAAFFSASFEFLLATGILCELGYQISVGATPVGRIMIMVSAVALAANALCTLLLMRFRHEGINMRAVWLCTRNDAIGNAATVLAGCIVLALNVAWPDWVAGGLIAALFIGTSLGVMREAWPQLGMAATSS